MLAIKPQPRFSRRHRLGRLRLRLDGIEAQRVLHPPLHQSLRPAGREQIRPRGGRVRQPVLEEPRRQSFSGPRRAARLAPAAAGSQRSRRERRHSRQASSTGSPAKRNSATRRSKKLSAETGDPDLKQALAWSLAVNKSIADMVRDVPPFPYVRALPRTIRRPGRHDRLLANAERSPGSGVEGARHRPLRARRFAARRSAAKRNRWPTPSNTRRTTRS